MGEMASGTSPFFFPFLYHFSHSALDFLLISVTSSDCFGFCSLFNCPRGSEPQQSFPFTTFFLGGVDRRD